MKILVTGGAGFIGSAVVRQAIAAGHDVVNLDVLTYASSLENVASVAGHSSYAFEKVDICDAPELARIFDEHRPDTVVHLAAESHVDRSIDGPATFMNTNIMGTFHMLQAARAAGVDRFLHVSTDEVFGSLGPEGAFIETTPYCPRSPYSASKAASDHLVRAWHATYGMPVVLTNCSNNYGPYQFPEKLIPVVILNALAGAPIPIYGDGGNVRDWLYVEDHADALLCILQQGQDGRSYNIGGGNAISNLTLVNMICDVLDRLRPAPRPYAELISFVQDRPGHDERYAIDATRLRDELGWVPSVALDEGLTKTVAWYLDNTEWLDRDGVGARLGLR